MTDIDYLENLFEDKTCGNCFQDFDCPEEGNKNFVGNTCNRWKNIEDFAKDVETVKNIIEKNIKRGKPNWIA